jgi:hypothetical protein
VLSHCHFTLVLGLLLAAVGTREAVAHPGVSGGVFTACLLPAGAAVFTQGSPRPRKRSPMMSSPPSCGEPQRWLDRATAATQRWSGWPGQRIPSWRWPRGRRVGSCPCR